MAIHTISSVIHRRRIASLHTTIVAALLLSFINSAVGGEPCRLVVLEKSSRRPVPLVELRTTHGVRFVSDNAGVIACDLPELMGRPTWFTVLGHGYEVPADGFGSRGVRITPEPGRTIEVLVDRKIIAQRLGRITGAGLFAESQKTGTDRDWPESGIMGSDSVLTAVHRGRLFWLWGDTNVPHYPLGIFQSTGATSTLQPLESYEAPLRLCLEYFRDARGLPRGIAPMPGPGPTWLTGYVSVRDNSGTSRLVATYMKVTPPLSIYEWGLCVWNDEQAKFEPLRKIWTKSSEHPQPPPVPEGHVVLWTDDAGREWLLFGNPFPRLRVPARFEDWQDSTKWEVLTPQATVTSAADRSKVKPHTGSIAYNAFRKRWVTVFMEHFGKPSAFGELWYAEASAPTGPWGPAVKVLSHNNYTFYNPKLHPNLTPADSPILLFEGTYTKQFADRPEATPRYDYNQILYRLDLDDPALAKAQR